MRFMFDFDSLELAEKTCNEDATGSLEPSERMPRFIKRL